MVNRLLALLLGCLALLGSVGATIAQAADNPGRVLLVGITGLEWADVTEADTPTLYELMEQAHHQRRATCRPGPQRLQPVLAAANARA